MCPPPSFQKGNVCAPEDGGGEPRGWGGSTVGSDKWGEGWLEPDQGRGEHVGRCDGFHLVPREKHDENEESNYETLGVNTHTKIFVVLLAISQCEGAPTYIGSQSRIIAKTWESGSQPHLTVVGIFNFLSHF